MKKIIAFFVVMMGVSAGFCAGYPSDDWKEITGRDWNEYQMILKLSQPVPKGLGVYYLDSYPCFGQAGKTRLLMEYRAKGDYYDAIFLSCVSEPKTIKLGFRYQDHTKEKGQGLAEGIMNCAVVRDESERYNRRYWVDVSTCSVETIQ